MDQRLNLNNHLSKLPNSMKKVVVIGGGNGGAKTIRACKQCIDEIELSAVISVSDSGGSSGRLREEFSVLPPGDLLRAILAMSTHDYDTLKSIFYTPRFAVDGKLSGHNIGNMFLALASEYSEKDIMNAIRALEQGVGAQGRVFPSTLEQTQLVVELEDGTVLRGEHDIDRPATLQGPRIARAWLEPTGQIYEGARAAIEDADYILFGPGSLYCSIVATILPEGFKDALTRSRAKFIYIVGNAYEETGEAGPTRLSDFVHELEKYLPRKLDAVVYNNHELSEEQLGWYAEKKWKLFEPDLENLTEYNIVKGDYG